jgi:hypothetical protein
MSNCIACGNNVLIDIYHPEPSPLVALNLPKSEEAAISAIKLPMTFKMCGICGHVFNVDFQYAQVPYEGDSNRMYNAGPLWQEHMKGLINHLIENVEVWKDGQVIDIGCGDGQFLRMLKEAYPAARCVGYEPGVDARKQNPFTVVQDYFIPERDLRRHNPSILLCRHVLEHLENPREFIAQIAYWSGVYGIEPIFVAEVPCIDTSLEVGRLSDFLYEHVSNFTMESLAALFMGSGFELLEIKRCYGEEVLVGVFKPRTTAIRHTRTLADTFTQKARDSVERVKEQLNAMKHSQPVVLWGGTGKSAAFINNHKLDAARFPVVVDSDSAKWGKFVPGTGQMIQNPGKVVWQNNTVIVITTPWRADDIYKDICSRPLRYGRLVVLQVGEMKDYEPSAI